MHNNLITYVAISWGNGVERLEAIVTYLLHNVCILAVIASAWEKDISEWRKNISHYS